MHISKLTVYVRSLISCFSLRQVGKVDKGTAESVGGDGWSLSFSIGYIGKAMAAPASGGSYASKQKSEGHPLAIF